VTPIRGGAERWTAFTGAASLDAAPGRVLVIGPGALRTSCMAVASM
jgi:hypothetical protein